MMTEEKKSHRDVARGCIVKITDSLMAKSWRGGGGERRKMDRIISFPARSLFPKIDDSANAPRVDAARPSRETVICAYALKISKYTALRRILTRGRVSNNCTAGAGATRGRRVSAVCILR